MSRATIPGFDYVAGKQLSLTRAEWQARLAAVVKAGGTRRVEQGETFGSLPMPKDGKPYVGGLQFEVYANISLRGDD